MIRNFTLIIFIILIAWSNEISRANISIIATVDGDIITNYDIKKESDYLQILNQLLPSRIVF